ncbi:organic solute transporter Ostalpha-domain-containing protein [Suillus ampliporus]|nr:organic solute transporter Ostalpha-domain-containing protein [Suillus ampliporus]
MAPTCPSDNTAAVDQSSFWSSGNLNWDQHRIGWAIAGGCAVLTVLISMVSVLQHCRNYNKPHEQRQILRILYMPPVYAVISFFSYRYFRSYTYYELIEAGKRLADLLSHARLLLIEFVAATAAGRDAKNAIARKDKRPLPFPFCRWRYRPTKPYFMYTLKWSVLQYVIIRPAVSIAGIICQLYNVLCESGPYSIYYANVYLEAVDFVSISVALYGLILFYGLTKEELVGRRPLAKFLSIKLIVMFTFYQSFVFSALEGRVIKATQYWTAANIADGLNALAICIEMVFFAVFMMQAYTVNEYKVPGNKKTSIWRPLWDSVNYWDFLTEIWGSFKFFFDFARGVPSTHSSKKADFAQAFGIDGRSVAGGNKPQLIHDEESIRLAPYPYSDTRNADSASPVLS